MERRDFVGSMLAIFCGVAMPEPIVECLRLIQPITLVKVPGEVVWTDDIDEMLKRVYCDPLVNGIVSDSELLEIFAQHDVVDMTAPNYVDAVSYFELPQGWRAVSE